jgi:broad specificity phosphatase PhoE
MMLKQVLLIRHGETDWNAEQRWQGHNNIPLNRVGIAQAEALAEKVGNFSPEVLLSSDLARAQQTAQVIARRLKIPFYIAEQLREVNVGGAEGLGTEEIVQRFGPETIRRWRSIHPDDLDFAFDCGETKLAAVRRALKELVQFLHSTEVDSVCVVTHGMLIRTLIHYLFPRLETPLPVSNCAHYALTYDTSLRRWDLVGESFPDMAGALCKERVEEVAHGF